MLKPRETKRLRSIMKVAAIAGLVAALTLTCGSQPAQTPEASEPIPVRIIQTGAGSLLHPTMELLEIEEHRYILAYHGSSVSIIHAASCPKEEK